MAQAHIIVVGNEKGGAGKSTVAVHIATALLHEGARVVTIDLDTRQQTMGHFFANRSAWIAANDASLPTPAPMMEIANRSDLDRAMAQAADFIIIDTPGADTELSREAHGRANLIVTPMNDSFVDFDVLGQVDPISLEVLRPSLYALTVWEARKARGHPPRIGDRLGGPAQRAGGHGGSQPAQGRRKAHDPGQTSRISTPAGPQRSGHLSRAVSVRPDRLGPVPQRATRAGVAQPCGGASGTADAVAGAWPGGGRRHRPGRRVIYLIVGGGILGLLVWVGRRPAMRADRYRLGRGLVAALAAVAAVVAGLRGAWMASAALIIVSAFLGGSVRTRGTPRSDSTSMSAAQARSILGVGPNAGRAEIEEAYRRLIRRVHPDVGGAAGLAAHLNAARDVLLKA